jgi:hypothetical protein
MLVGMRGVAMKWFAMREQATLRVGAMHSVAFTKWQSETRFRPRITRIQRIRFIQLIRTIRAIRGKDLSALLAAG